MVLIDLIMILAPPLAFVEQYKMIRSSGSLGTFSTLTCAILLISNIMRVFYWQASGFALPLLFQSLLMIVAQVLLLKACVQTKKSNQDEKFQLTNFWQWTKFQHYLRFLVGFTSLLAILTTVLKITPLGKPYGQLIGFVSMMTEACLGMPQLIKNYRQKSVKGLSYVMILAWFLGDSFKTFYFIWKKQPMQFVMCGVIQLTVDILILLQMFFYKQSNQKVRVATSEAKDDRTL